MPTEMELTLEQTQQGVSYEVSVLLLIGVADSRRMTTSVGNNSVFRSFFKKQKLTGPSFIDWYRQLQLVLSTEDKEKYLEQPIPPAPVAAAPDQPISP
ncbi:hypothetical protein Tco_0874977 [Tanacetum coccineum]|uniref:Uncharacterized protein n=1 Tax=Tanacetum coccineum TaxID=301880 RepID=A0ABQ5BNI6_9ASTR